MDPIRRLSGSGGPHLLAAAALIAAAAAAIGTDLAPALQKIDNQLEGSEGPEQSLARVKELLAEREAGAARSPFRWLRTDPTPALRLIVELERIGSERNCSAAALRLAQRPRLNLVPPLYRPDGGRPIDELLFRLIRAHAVVCRERFAAAAIENLDLRVPAPLQARVTHFREQLERASAEPEAAAAQKGRLGRWLANHRLHGARMGVAGYYALLYAAQRFDDPEVGPLQQVGGPGKTVADAGLLKRIFLRQVGRPCAAYLRMRPFLVPLIFGLRFYFAEPDWFEPDRYGPLYEALKNYHTCALLEAGEADQLMNDMVRQLRVEASGRYLTY